MLLRMFREYIWDKGLTSDCLRIKDGDGRPQALWKNCVMIIVSKLYTLDMRVPTFDVHSDNLSCDFIMPLTFYSLSTFAINFTNRLKWKTKSF